MKNRMFSGSIGILIGYVLLILAIDILSKPDNIAVSLKPFESFATYFFGFVFVLGNLGWIVGGIFLVVYFIICFRIAAWIGSKIING